MTDKGKMKYFQTDQDVTCKKVFEVSILLLTVEHLTISCLSNTQGPQYIPVISNNTVQDKRTDTCNSLNYKYIYFCVVPSPQTLGQKFHKLVAVLRSRHVSRMLCKRIRFTTRSMTYFGLSFERFFICNWVRRRYVSRTCPITK